MYLLDLSSRRLMLAETRLLPVMMPTRIPSVLALLKQFVHAIVEIDVLVVVALVQLDVFRECGFAFGFIDVAAQDHLVRRTEVGANLRVGQYAADPRFQNGVETLVDQRQRIGDGAVEVENDGGETRHA